MKSGMNKLMGRLRSGVLALIAALAMLSPQAASAEEGAWQKLKSFAHDQKKEAIAEGRKVIAETNSKVSELKKDAKHSSAETRVAHKKNMQELAAKKNAAKAQLSKLQKASAQSWDSTKEGVSNAYRELHLAYEKASASARK